METILENKYIQNLLDFIFPQLCLGCGAYCENEKNICTNCENKIEEIKLPYCLHCMNYMHDEISCEICADKTFALYSYTNYADPIREIIIQFKFRGITLPAEIFAKRIYALYANLLKKYNADYLIPIPLHKSRENARGYNQASLFANEIEKLSGIKVNETILYRIKKRKPQAKLAVSERKKNIDSVFSVETGTTELKKCIIIDDVVTTGSTVFEAAKELENSGYKVVAVISIAHAF